ncbi:MAG: ABC transporter permease [Clostridium sp.]|nr:ABC transporter permease [Acetatifactor muris]MCM1528191.1 ABC transporter permease [Bacteroides sp.]MCM1564268.1 ABC transporter permease [Clostridium sp.]
MQGVLRRLVRIFFTYGIRILSLLLAVSALSFALVCASPEDPVSRYILGLGTAVSSEQRAEIEAYWGVNEPPVERYLNWLSEILRGNFGESALYRRPVAKIISERFVNSLALMFCAWILSGAIGFALGCIMGMCRGGPADRILKKVCYILSAIPTFWLGLVFLLIFAVWLKWFPIGFSAPIGVLSEDVTLGQKLYHLILPAFTLSLMSFSNIALHTRQKLADVFESEYVLFARARGERKLTILRRHGLRNILFPALTLQFASFAELFGGSVIAENVFSYPGLGSAVSAAGLSGDVPLLLGVTLCSTLFVCVGNLIANLLYGVIDPQVREVSR